MAQPSIIPVILGALEPYLEEAQREFHDRGGLLPTLPVTGEGKVNVRQIVRELMKRDPSIIESHEQHFYRKREIYTLVDSVAEDQGIGQIGSRVPGEEHDAARRRIGKLSGELSQLRQALAELAASNETLRRKLASVEESLALVEETGMIFRSGDAK